MYISLTDIYKYRPDIDSKVSSEVLKLTQSKFGFNSNRIIPTYFELLNLIKTFYNFRVVINKSSTAIDIQFYKDNSGELLTLYYGYQRGYFMQIDLQFIKFLNKLDNLI